MQRWAGKLHRARVRRRQLRNAAQFRRLTVCFFAFIQWHEGAVASAVRARTLTAADAILARVHARTRGEALCAWAAVAAASQFRRWYLQNRAAAAWRAAVATAVATTAAAGTSALGSWTV
jgi:hypothetical protein